jgi:cell division protein FtsB
MARAKTNRAANGDDAEKRISLTVAPQGPDGADIHVEVKEYLSAKKRRSQRRFATFFFAVMTLAMFPMARDFLSYLQMKHDYEELQKHNQELRALQQQLEDEREALYSPAMIEKLAREELDMVFPGESKVYNAIPTNDIPRREGLKAGEKLH